MLGPVINNPWVRALGILVLIVCVGVLAYLLSPVLVSLFFAFLVAYVFDPLVDMFEKRRISRGVAIACLALIAFTIVLALPLYFVPSVVVEADALIGVASKGFGDFSDSSGILRAAVDKLPLRSLVESIGWAPADDPTYDPLSVLTVGIAERVREPAVAFLKNNVRQIASTGESAGLGVMRFFSTLGQGLMGLVLFLGNLALFAFVAAYLLKDFDAIVATAADLIPPRHRTVVGGIVSKIDSQIKGFLRGQMLVCACLGIMYGIGLFIAGVPFAWLLALFGAVASFVPYLGLALTIAPAIVLCVLQHQGIDWHLGAVLTTFVVAQLLEGTVLTPKIVGDQVGLGPVWVILAVLVFGNALGFLGLLMAVPIAASLKVLVVEALDRYKASTLYTGEPRREKLAE